MHTFAENPKTTQPTTSANATMVSRAHVGQGHDPNSILNLQRKIGNQALLRLLQSNTEERNAVLNGPTPLHLGHDFSRIPVHPPAPGAIQTKLAINRPVDEYEQEADRVSESVMRMSEPQQQGACACGGECPRCQMDEHRRLQTKHVDSTASGQTGARPIVEEALANGGGSLPDGLRADMEQRFGHDFGRVRLHTQARAAESAAAVGARAYTVGPDVVFAAGEYVPDTDAGRRLIAHELAHVIQQQQAGVARVMRQPTEAEEKRVVAPPCPGSCHVHVEHYRRAFGSGLEPLPVVPLERKQVPLSQTELQTLYDWIARSGPGTVSRVAPPTSNELTGGQLKADVAAEYAGHEEEFRAKPNNRVQIIRFEVPDESDPDWSKYKASEISADQKKKTFAALGLRPEEKVFSRTVSSKDFGAYIAAQNADAAVFGIIVQLPTPPQLRADVSKIAPGKDLDALSAGKGRTFKAPATAEGVVRVVLAILKPGQTVAVIGGGRDPGFGALGFVGGAVVELLRDRGITVKVFEKGDDLREVKKYDVVVSAVGTPRVVNKEHLKPEHELVVDTGFIPEKGGKPVGDVEESARSIPRYITAVPGGTGPIEMAVLMERAAKLLGIKVRTWRVELRDGKLRAVFVE